MAFKYNSYNLGVPLQNTPSQILPPTYPPAIEDIQEIISPIPSPDQLPNVSLPARINAPSIGRTVAQGNPFGLIINPARNSYNGVFVLPPSIINK